MLQQNYPLVTKWPQAAGKARRKIHQGPHPAWRIEILPYQSRGRFSNGNRKKNLIKSAGNLIEPARHSSLWSVVFRCRLLKVNGILHARKSLSEIVEYLHTKEILCFDLERNRRRKIWSVPLPSLQTGNLEETIQSGTSICFLVSHESNPNNTIAL